MQVFKAYFKILKKQMFPILLYGGLFFGIMIMLTRNMAEDNNQFTASKITAMVINKDGESGLISGFLDYMGQYVIFAEPEKEEQSVQDALYYRKVAYVLTIPRGFTESFLKNGEIALTKLSTPDSMEAITVDRAVDNYFNMARVYKKQMPDIDMEDLNTYVWANLQEQTQVIMDRENLDKISASNSFNKSYFNTLGYILIAAFITCISMVMFSFHSLDLRRRHSAAPLSNRRLNLQLISANLLFVLCYLLFFIAAGFLLNKNRTLNVSILLFCLNAAVFAVVALSISYLVGISVSSKKAITAIATAVSLGLAFLSGIFVPQEYLGTAVLKAASFTPAYWYVKANDTIDVLIPDEWADISEIAGCMAIQLGFAAAIISVALVVGKRKRQQAG